MTPQDLLRKLFPPMLATLAEGIPKDRENWLYEHKYDGFRATAAIVDGDLALWSRNSLDLSGRFPRIAEVLRKLRVKSAVIDGEIVALDPHGAPRFQLLQRGETAETIYFVFDLIWLEGHDLRKLPLEERRGLLEKLFSRPPKLIRVAERIEGEPEEALDEAARHGYEGLIAKRRGSRYENRRTKEWLKLKAQNQQELAIIGFTPSTHSDKEIGALLLGVYEKGELHYAGKVGTGFSARQRVDFQRDLRKEATSKLAVKGAPRMRDATWVEPRLVAQVRFTEWTSDGKLRHPAFLGLRDDKKPAECVREVPAAPNGEAMPKTEKKKTTTTTRKKAAPKPVEKQQGPTVVLTNPDRMLYPRDKITKKDVAAYYEAMSGPMINALEGRPLALEHWNQGIDKASWFHQDIGREAEEWMTTVETPVRTAAKTIDHLVVDRPETLRWLAQRSVLTIHMWSSRAENLERPDWMVLDLDPPKGEGIEKAVDTALVLRALFEDLELETVPKTSGKRGIHIFVPLKPRYTHEEAADVACRIAEVVAARLPYATVERSLSKRKGRLYLDCMQNGYGKTIVAPYSLRAIDGAPVSTPLKWSEVTRKLDPLKYNLRTMPERLAKAGDLFAPVLEKKNTLPKLK